MKIIAVSDIHIPKNNARLPQMVDAINKSDAEVLILGGDIAPANDAALEDFLASISNFRGLKMYVSMYFQQYMKNMAFIPLKNNLYYIKMLVLQEI